MKKYENLYENGYEKYSFEYGNCVYCGKEGKKIEEKYICLCCHMNIISNGEIKKRKVPVYESREHEMYLKAKNIYLDTPRFLGKQVNDRVVAIAYDRYIAKKYNRKINSNLYKELPLDVI